MAIRRLTATCDCLLYTRSRNSTGDECISARVCGKPLAVVSEHELNEWNDDTPSGQMYQILKCGHARIVEKWDAKAHSERNTLWDNLLPFQKEFVEFAEKAPNMRALCCDEMGMGKTPMALSVVRENHERFTNNGTQFCIFIVLPGAVYQWEEEIGRWLGLDKPKDLTHLMMMPQLIITAGQKISPLSKVIVIPWSRLGDEKVFKQIEKVGVASMIIDEIHFFKHQKSKRTQALMKYAKLAGMVSPMIGLSGTLAENRVSELFTAFHLCDPQFFNQPWALTRMCLSDDRGHPTVLSPRWKSVFFDRIKNYRLGRKKADVNIPLPPFSNDTVVWLDPSEFSVNEEWAIMYNKTLDEMREMLDAPDPDARSIIGLMQQLRHWTGKMKILGAAVYIDNWMTANPGEKLCVGVHHIAVRTTLAELLKHRNPLQMSSEDAKEKDEIERGFRNGASNLLIANILSAGVGRNMQFCKNAIVLERQWNRSREEQFEQRFWRIIQDEDGRVKEHFTQADKVTITYLNGRNTFDEYFDPRVDLTGLIVDSIENEDDEEMPPPSFILDLARTIVDKRQKWVGI